MRMLEERRKLLKDGEVELEVQKRELSEEQSKLKVEQSNLELDQMKLQGIEEDIAQRRLEVDDCRKDIETKQAKLEKETKALQKTKDETEILLESLRKLLRQRKINQRKPTTQDMVDTHKSTWYTRRGETKEILSLIHGSEEGAIVGAWNFVCSHASSDQIDEFLAHYKKGKYMQCKWNEITKKFESSDEALKQALAMKYRGFMSRRKYNVQCKTLSSVFDPNKAVWLPRNVRIDGIDITSIRQLSHGKLDRFVKSIDVGQIHNLPREVGVTRSVTGLVHMIVDLHLRVPHLAKQLRWFNNKQHHFIFQFSDDGTQEAADTPMSVGSLTSWNFHRRVNSRDLHYLLHIVNAQETDGVMEGLWQQHTQEMQLLEASTFTINGTSVTFEFVPSADQKWQCWANNETNNAASFPSPFADVSKQDMVVVGGEIGTTWQPWTNETRTADAAKVEKFVGTLPRELSDGARKAKINKFLATNRLRQLGVPRIGKYAALQRPDPLHAEINCAAHYLNLLYHEALSRGTTCLSRFLSTLEAPVHDTEIARETCHEVEIQADNGDFHVGEGVGARARACVSVTNAAQSLVEALHFDDIVPSQGMHVLGLGLKSLAKDLQDHYDNESTRHNKWSARLIGEHAIMIESFGYRLTDSLFFPGESPAEELRRLVLGKVGQCLRDAASIFSQVEVTEEDLQTLEWTCSRYYNLLCLFIPTAVSLPVWTVAKAIPYHARILWTKYGIGYGILSLQAKESKHAALKADLGFTNRCKAPGKQNKWVQVFRANYMRSFYLEEYCPCPQTYNPHFHCRVPKHAGQVGYCLCGRDIPREDVQLCSTCENACAIVQCADEGILSPRIIALLKPFECTLCRERFADSCALEAHNAAHQPPPFHGDTSTERVITDPRSLTVVELRKECRRHGLAGFGGSSALYTDSKFCFQLL
ncbi:hypothetical protein Bbelb_293030 [Branchiostoma belcheri]|nr:hypothetical protein Bbelb_293030 [Branchiostoma belcheri]